MKINPIVIHDSADKSMKGKPEPTEKMRKKHDSLMGSWGWNDLPAVW